MCVCVCVCVLKICTSCVCMSAVLTVSHSRCSSHCTRSTFVPACSLGVDGVAKFLVDNHHLSKAMIGDYLGDRRNTEVLTAFVR